MRVAIIPARGGSRRVPRKNVREFAGRPMIAWSILAARASGCFDRIIVSTDDPHIAEAGVTAGAEAPFLRPTDISDDMTGTGAVLAHATRWLWERGELDSTSDFVCCIYATAPFLDPADLRSGEAALRNTGSDYVLAIAAFQAPVQRALSVSSEGRLRMLQPQYVEARSQDLEPAFFDAGQFCWGRADAWLEGRQVIGSNCSAVIIPAHRVNDIDSPEDWERAECMFRALGPPAHDLSGASQR